MKTPITTHAKDEEDALVAAIVKLGGTTLVCWQHEGIPQIAQSMRGPRDRFDVVWRLTRESSRTTWTFTQICPLLLAGDLATPIA